MAQPLQLIEDEVRSGEIAKLGEITIYVDNEVPMVNSDANVAKYVTADIPFQNHDTFPAWRDLAYDYLDYADAKLKEKGYKITAHGKNDYMQEVRFFGVEATKTDGTPIDAGQLGKDVLEMTASFKKDLVAKTLPQTTGREQRTVR